MKKILLLLAILFTCLTVFAQDFPSGQISSEEMEMKKYDKDTSAHAVFINEYGTSRINFTNDYHIRVTFEYHAKIKFFDSKEFEREGTFEIPVYNGNDMVYEQVEDVKGITYYKDDNGVTQQAKLDPKKIITVKETTAKFIFRSIRLIVPAPCAKCKTA